MSTVRAILLLVALSFVGPPAAQAADIFAVGSQLRLTQVGANGDIAIDANNPAVAYNSRDNEYLLVWIGKTTAAADNEVLGRVLDGSGNPKGPVQFLSSVPDDEFEPVDPVVGYSPKIDQYVIGYIASPKVIGGTPPNSPLTQREVIGQVVTTTGARSGPPARISNTDADSADPDFVADLAMAYDAEHDLFRFVWLSDSSFEGDFEVKTQAVLSSFVNPESLPEQTISNTPLDANEPVIAYMPAQDRWAVAWEAGSASGTEIVSCGGRPRQRDTRAASRDLVRRRDGHDALGRREHSAQRDPRVVRARQPRDGRRRGLRPAPLGRTRADSEYHGPEDLLDGSRREHWLRRLGRAPHDRRRITRCSTAIS